MSFQIKRGTNSQRLGYTAASGELIYATDTKILYVGDGTTPGGVTVGTVASVGASAGVSSINGLSGAVVFSAGSGLTLTLSGNTLTFASTGAVSGITNYVQSINGSTGVITNAAFLNIPQTFTQTQSFINGLTATGITLVGKEPNYIAELIFGSSGISTAGAVDLRTYNAKVSLQPGSIFIGPENIVRVFEIDAGLTLPASGIYIGTDIFGGTAFKAVGPMTVIGNSILSGGFYSPAGPDARTSDYNLLFGSGVLGSATYGNLSLNVICGDAILESAGLCGSVSGGLFRNTLIGSQILQNPTTQVNLLDNIFIGTESVESNPSGNIDAQSNILIGSRIASNAANLTSKSSIIIGDKAIYRLPTNAGLTYDNIVMIGGRHQATDSASNKNRDLPFGESAQLLLCSGFTSWIYGNSAGNVLVGEPRTVGRPAERLHVAGNIYAGGTYMYIANSFTPASAGASGTTGAIAWDSNFLYVCVGTNTWKRAGLTSW